MQSKTLMKLIKGRAFSTSSLPRPNPGRCSAREAVWEGGVEWWRSGRQPRVSKQLH